MDLLKEIERVEEKLKLKDLKELSSPIWKKEDFYELLQSPIFRLSFPEELLNRKFTDLLKPFIFDGGKKTIYCKLSRRIDFDNDQDKKRSYLFSAVTQEMIDADLEYFSNMDAPDRYSMLDMLYKPYFYELRVYKNMEVDSESWYKVTISKPKSNDDKKEIGGFISYGASPFRFQQILIEWGEKVNPPKYELEQKNIVPAPDQKIAKAMDELFSNVSESILRVHRVGQANCISGWNTINGNERQFAFDLGFPIDNFLIFKNSTAEVDKKATGILDDDTVIRDHIKPELIIISHWHQDHYKAAYAVRRDIFIGKDAATWIAPLYKVVDYDESANRLVAYLIKTGKILFVPEKYSGYVQGNYMLCRGTGNDLNDSCLMLQMNSTLLPGDCDYDNWPSNYGKNPAFSIENIIVPHHAARTDQGKAQSKLGNIFQGSKKKAIICVGNNAGYHPNTQTVDIYNQLNFNEILKTDNAKCNFNDFFIRDL